MKFEWYVLNSNFNRKVIEPYNIFNNAYVNNMTLKIVKRYLRLGKNYTYKKFNGEEIKGFDGFKAELNSIIMYEEWARCEYEILVADMFYTEQTEKKIDCWYQANMNLEALAYEVIRQYKKYLKENK